MDDKVIRLVTAIFAAISCHLALMSWQTKRNWFDYVNCIFFNIIISTLGLFLTNHIVENPDWVIDMMFRLAQAVSFVLLSFFLYDKHVFQLKTKITRGVFHCNMFTWYTPSCLVTATVAYFGKHLPETDLVFTISFFFLISLEVIAFILTLICARRQQENKIKKILISALIFFATLASIVVTGMYGNPDFPEIIHATILIVLQLYFVIYRVDIKFSGGIKKKFNPGLFFIQVQDNLKPQLDSENQKLYETLLPTDIDVQRQEKNADCVETKDNNLEKY